MKKRLLKTYEGEPTAQRGGRRKIYFELTDQGKRALLEIQKVHSAIWTEMPVLKFK